MSDLLQRAAIAKLRFATNRGGITSEELYTLPLTSTTGKVNLIDLAKGVAIKLRESSDDDFDFVETASPQVTADNLRLDILKMVITHVRARNAAKTTALVAKQEKSDIVALIADKRREERGKLSLAELEAQLEKL